MSTSPSSQPTSKRKRKATRVVESDNESDYEQPTKVETSPSPSPTKQGGRKVAISRAPKRKVTTSTQKVSTSQEEMTEETAPASPIEKPVLDAKGKGRATVVNTDGERPAKRPRLPSMRRKDPGTAGTTPAGSNTPMLEKTPATGPIARKIVGEPATNEIDMQAEGALQGLLKKAGSGKSDAQPRYDLTTSEKMDMKKAELNKMKDEYAAQKARNRKPPFDLGAQNRKLVDVQRMLEDRRSRVCVNVVGSCIDKVYRGWSQLLQKQTTSSQ